MNVISIVEGNGEVAALPLLLRRIGQWKTPHHFPNILHPIRVHKDRFLNKDHEFRRHVLLASHKCAERGWILILLDADDDCPAQLGAETLRRAKEYAPHRAISVVIANREYEAWFIASAVSLDGKRGFCFGSVETVDAETPRDAKGWMKARMKSCAYRETTDQAAFTASMDLEQAFQGSRSFRKLCSEWVRQFDLGCEV